jgi:endothelin-converting enzyme/putative endopeptidase
MQMAIVGAGGLGLPDRDYYFRDDARSVELRKQYVEHIAKMLQLEGTPAEQAAAASATVMRVETEIARPQLDVVARRDPANVNHKMKLEDLQKLTPGFSWRDYFKPIDAPAFSVLNVTQPKYLQALDGLLDTTPIADVKEYLRWHLLRANANFLPTAFVNESFRFYGTILRGTPELRPRWKRCVEFTDGDLGEALGKVYVAQAFGPQAKADTLAMLAAIEGALRDDIGTLTWMTDDTRKEALVKLRAVAHKIGYPDRWRDYSRLRIARGDALGNSQREHVRLPPERRSHRQARRSRRVGHDAANRQRVPQPDGEQHQLPRRHPAAAVLLRQRNRRPTSAPPAPSSATSSRTGSTIRAATSTRRATSGMVEARRREAVRERAQCLVDEYNGFAIGDAKVNGRLTLGENTADNGGLRLALAAYWRPPRHRPQGPTARRTASRPSSGSSSATARSGVRSAARSRPPARCRPARTRPAASAPTAPSRTCRSSPGRSPARPTRRWCAPTRAASGRTDGQDGLDRQDRQERHATYADRFLCFRASAGRCAQRLAARSRADDSALGRAQVGGAALARSHGRCLHRLLSVRLRRMARGQPDSRRPSALGPVRSARRTERTDPPEDPREPRAAR